MNIVVTGSLAFDYIMDFPQSFEENILPDKIKTLSVSFLAHNFSKNFGGVAGNIAYNLGLLQLQPFILSSAGKRDFAFYKKHLKKAGVDTSWIHIVPKEFTANMFLITDKNNCQIAGFYPGAMNNDSALLLSEIQKHTPIDFLIVAPTVPTAMRNFVAEAKNRLIPYLYDPAQQIPGIEKQDLQNGIEGAEILIGNDYELALLMKKTGFSKTHILKKTKLLITTLGEKGSLIETKDKQIVIESIKVSRVIDPTGAGDAYIAGFVSSYLQGKDLLACGKTGATLASFAIEKYGTQNHRFGISQFQKRYTQLLNT